jgi:hypothetical protein
MVYLLKEVILNSSSLQRYSESELIRDLERVGLTVVFNKPCIFSTPTGLHRGCRDQDRVHITSVTSSHLNLKRSAPESTSCLTIDYRWITDRTVPKYGVL